MKQLIIFWKFTRPHTIIGSALSILSLFALAQFTSIEQTTNYLQLALSLLSALGCNIFITGLNQWVDVEVDKINKPWLPIASGELSRDNALKIVIISFIASLVLAATQGWQFFLLICLISFVGFAYSMPPLKLKREHFGAAAAIALVRGLLVNLGFYLHFSETNWDMSNLPDAVIPLIVFVTAFSLGIAWFKDIPDTEGDTGSFNTLAVVRGKSTAFWLGYITVVFAYAFLTYLAWSGFFPNENFALLAHGVPLLWFNYRALKLDLTDPKAIKSFYMFFWGLFFLEYLVFPFCFS